MYMRLKWLVRMENCSAASSRYLCLVTVSMTAKASFSGMVQRSCEPLNLPEVNASGAAGCERVGSGGTLVLE
jgi:hypothetical protein